MSEVDFSIERLTESGFGELMNGLIVPARYAERRTIGWNSAVVLDPVCGSGTTAEASERLNRRFICIDISQDAIDIAFKRLRFPERCVQVNWVLEGPQFRPEYWLFPVNYLVKGDCLEVLRSMPDGFVNLVCADPPFNANRNFFNKEGVGFSDVWKWDAAAEKRLDEIRRIPVEEERYLAGETQEQRINARRSIELQIEACLLREEGDRASYLTWAALLICELRRLM